MGVVEELVEAGDLEELIGFARRVADGAEWDVLDEVRERCDLAVRRGKQLRAVAAYADYRLALGAPSPMAAAAVARDAGGFTLGPLAEVAASTRAWDELCPHLAAGPAAAAVAAERVVRGESLTTDARIDPTYVEMPLRLQPWEPAYAVAQYRSDDADFPMPDVDAPMAPAPKAAWTPSEDPSVTSALLDLVTSWRAESNGRAAVACVEGAAAGAIGALGVPRSLARMAEITAADGLALMAWAGASGGAHGRRRGAAAGRFAAWWAATALTGVAGTEDPWPPPADDLGEAVGELRWFAWDASEPVTGWRLNLAIEDPAEDLAWAIAASDAD